MKCRQKSWLLRADPKDPNAVLGMNLNFYTEDEWAKNELVKNGLYFFTLFPGATSKNAHNRIRVKWVYTLETINAERV